MTPTQHKNLYKRNYNKELTEHNNAWDTNEKTLEDEEDEDGIITMPDSFRDAFDDHFETME